MSDLSVTQTDRAARLEFDEALYPKDAIYGAAYIFIDRCYVHLDRPSDGRVVVSLRLKAHVTAQLDELAGEFENELLGQAWRRQITEDNRTIIELISTRALAGAAGPPGLDDLLNMDAGGGAFEDPLGIAMSWEDKYKKKKPEGVPAAEAAEGGEAAPAAAAPAESPADGKGAELDGRAGLQQGPVRRLRARRGDQDLRALWHLRAGRGARAVGRPRDGQQRGARGAPVGRAGQPRARRDD
jgi:His-Xaa-Ser system protein HxsD